MRPPRKQWNELPPDQLARALGGNRKDLDTLVRWYGPVVWAAVAARVRGIPALAVQMEDLVGSVWLELCRNDMRRLRYFDSTRGEFGYFIRLQAGQIAWKLVLRQLGRPALDLAAHEPTDEGLEARVHSRDFLERLAALARARLGESDWAVLNATYVEGLTSEEVARRMEKKLHTLYQQKHRLRAKLEALVRELLAEDGVARGESERLVPVVLASLLAACPTPGTGPIDCDGDGVEVRTSPLLDPLVR